MLASVTMSSVYLSSNISSHQNISMCFNKYIYINISSLTSNLFRFLYESVHFYYRHEIIFPYIYCVFHHFKETVLISLCAEGWRAPSFYIQGRLSTGDGSVVDVIIGGLTRENHTDGGRQYLQIAWFYFLFYDMYHKHHSELFAITT